MLEHDMDLGQVPVMAISIVFAKKGSGFPSELMSFSTKLPSKRYEKIPVTFFTGVAFHLTPIIISLISN